MGKSKIEWTQVVWNPVTGCSKISPGCQNCYAERMTRRLQAMGCEKYRDGFNVRCHAWELYRPYRDAWPLKSVVFVNSMADLFHNNVPFAFIWDVFTVMNDACANVYQILTKRAERFAKIQALLPWADNIWMGVSVENQDYIYRIDILRNSYAKHKFISFEPLLGPLGDLDLSGIDWVIVGGESGPSARPLREEWVIPIQEQCEKIFHFSLSSGVA